MPDDPVFFALRNRASRILSLPTPGLCATRIMLL